MTSFSPCGRWLAVARRGQLRICGTDPSTARKVYKREHDHPIVALGFSTDGRLLASIDSEHIVRLWDLASGRDRGVIRTGKTVEAIKGVAFARGDQQLILVEHDSIHVWDLGTGKRVRTLGPSAGDFNRDMRMACVVSPRGDRLFVAYLGRLQSWDLEKGLEEKRFEELKREQEQFRYTSPGLSVSADGRFLAWVQNHLRLYEVASGRLIHTFPSHCSAAAFHPSQLHLAAASGESFDVLIHDLGAVFRSLPSPPGSWSGLSGRDATQAQGALWKLVTAAGMEEDLARHMKPVTQLDPGWLRRKIADLGSDQYVTRQNAEQELAAVLEVAQGALRESWRKTGGDLEQKLRLERLLARLERNSEHRLGQHRAVLALEARNTPQARRLLERFAGGMPGAGLTEEAKEALVRLRKQSVAVP